MYNGERPIGAAKGNQTNTMASCQSPPLHARTRRLQGRFTGSLNLHFAPCGTMSCPPV